jgi:hypothetical protein
MAKHLKDLHLCADITSLGSAETSAQKGGERGRSDLRRPPSAALTLALCFVIGSVLALAAHELGFTDVWRVMGVAIAALALGGMILDVEVES